MKEKLARWLYGRYGEDDLGRFLLVMYLILMVLNLFIDSDILQLLGTVMIVWILYRILSKNYYARRKENNTYLKIIQPWRRRFKLITLQMKDKEHRYYICPKCKQICRVVRSHKKGTITCPKCFHQFSGRS